MPRLTAPRTRAQPMQWKEQVVQQQEQRRSQLEDQEDQKETAAEWTSEDLQ